MWWFMIVEIVYIDLINTYIFKQIRYKKILYVGQSILVYSFNPRV